MLDNFLALVSSVGTGTLAAGIIVYLLGPRSFLLKYLDQKATNLATSQDIARITRQTEAVKIGYTAQLQELAHQNAIVLEELRSQKRLAAHAHEERFKAEFAIYKELWSLLIDVQDAGEDLTSAIKREPDSVDPTLIAAYESASQALLGTARRHMPFYDDSVQELMLQYNKLVKAAVSESKMLPPKKEAYIESLDISLKVTPIDRARALIALNRKLRDLFSEETLTPAMACIRRRLGFSVVSSDDESRATEGSTP